MTTHTQAGSEAGIDLDLAELEALERAATPGPWDIDTTRNDGEYGGGDDPGVGFDSYSIHDANGRVLLDTVNSDAASIEEDVGDEDMRAWDETARRNIEFIVALRNAFPALTAARRAPPAQTVADERALFEAWEAGRMNDMTREGCGYRCDRVHEAWLSWNEALAQPAAATGQAGATAAEPNERASWNTKQWYEHVGAWETPEGFISFGSVMAVRAMLLQFQRAMVPAGAYPSIQHPDDAAVDRFAASMKAKMAASRAKGRSGWDNEVLCPTDRLQSMLVDHLAKGDPIDIGNFAMMLWNRGERTAAAPVSPTAGATVAEERIKARFANRQRTPATADFDLPAPNDEIPAGMEDVSGAHHLTPLSILSTIADLREIESGTPVVPVENRDWRTWAGVLARVIEYLNNRTAPVSPAIGTVSIDTPEFRQMLWALWDEGSGTAAFDGSDSRVGKIIAHIDARLRGTAPSVNPWYQAVTDACAVACIDWDEADPRASVEKLIAWRVQIALDPAVSSAAPATQAADTDARDAALTEEWSFSTDEEHYRESEPSRLAIIRHALAEVEADNDGATGFWIGRNVRFTGRIDAGWIIEQLQEQAFDECGEWAETYLEDVTKDEEAELESIVNAWAARVDRSNFWTVKHTEFISIEQAREIDRAAMSASVSEADGSGKGGA